MPESSPSACAPCLPRSFPLVRQVSPPTTVRGEPDLVFLAAVLALLGIGVVAVYSAGAMDGLQRHGDSMYFLKRHLLWLALGAIAMRCVARVDYRRLRRFTYPLLLFSLLSLVAVLWVGTTRNEATRWFVLGPLSFQPSELAKLALISYLAFSLARKTDRVKTFSVGFVPHVLVCALMVGLLLKQPDLGSSMILGATTLTMLLVAGTRISYVLSAILVAAPVAYHISILGTSWRLQRFMAYLNPEAYSDGAAYQVVQSQYALGNGEFWGTGLGLGGQQLGYIPAGHSDFVLAAIGEQLGLIGIITVLLLFGVVLWRGVRIAIGASDVFGTFLAFGIIISFTFQVLIHTGVVMGVLPNKGLTLPFVSYGGSSLLLSMALVGLLMNISMRHMSVPKPRPAQVRSGARKRRKRVVVVAPKRKHSRRPLALEH